MALHLTAYWYVERINPLFIAVNNLVENQNFRPFIRLSDYIAIDMELL